MDAAQKVASKGLDGEKKFGRVGKKSWEGKKDADARTEGRAPEEREQKVLFPRSSNRGT